MCSYLEVLFPVKPCVSVTVSEFGIISRNYTDFRENEKTNISVHFCIALPYRQGFPFEKPKMFQKFLQNRLTKMSETPVNLFSEYPKISEILQKFKNSGLKLGNFENGRCV